ncbi:MAG: hypothetical protein GY817_03745 [bacterium]|nr:hypothetical protein [bacterium]
MEENFNWDDIDLLLDRLWGKKSFEKDHILPNVYQNDTCKWHKAVREVWIKYFSNEKLWISLFINTIESKYNSSIKQREPLPDRIIPKTLI